MLKLLTSSTIFASAAAASTFIAISFEDATRISTPDYTLAVPRVTTTSLAPLPPMEKGRTAEVTDDLTHAPTIELKSVADKVIQDVTLASVKVDDEIERIDREKSKAAIYKEEILTSLSAVEAIDLQQGHVTSLDELDATMATLESATKVYDQGFSMVLGLHEAESHRQLKLAIVHAQEVLLPQLRDDFGPLMREALADSGVTLMTIGQGYKTIKITSEDFTDKKVIEAFHAKIHKGLQRLRFTQADYYSQRSGEIFGAVSIDTTPDNKLILMGEGSMVTMLVVD